MLMLIYPLFSTKYDDDVFVGKKSQTIWCLFQVYIAMRENVYHLFSAATKSIQSYFQIMKRNELKNNWFSIISKMTYKQ